MENVRAKRANLLFFFLSQICKFVTFLLPSSSWLLEVPIAQFKQDGKIVKCSHRPFSY